MGVTILKRGALSEGGWVTIPGRPVGKGRPRLARSGHVITPTKTRKWEQMARAILRIGWVGPPMPKGTPARVQIEQVEPRPKRFKGPEHEHPCPSGGQHPDVDNVVKITMDSLNGVAWLDDHQACHLEAVKVWCKAGQPACVRVRVTEMEPDEQLSLWGVR